MLPLDEAGHYVCLAGAERVLALDLGTKTGFAISGPGAIIHGTWSFKPGRYDGGGMRFLRFRHSLEDAIQQGRIWKVVFEEVRRHAGVDAAHIYGGFMAHLTAICEEGSIPYEGVPVGTIKKFIAGKGNAGKGDVMDAVAKLGFRAEDDNAADALALLLHALHGQD